MKKTITGAAAAVAILAATGAQGGCGSSSSSGTTTVQNQGAPSTKKCDLRLTSEHPVNKQLTATVSVTCNFPIAEANTSLVIQGRPIGGDNTSWDNLGDPKTTGATTNITLSYTVPCITSLEYQASTSIDALADDGAPVNATDSTAPRSYNASECTQGKN